MGTGELHCIADAQNELIKIDGGVWHYGIKLLAANDESNYSSKHGTLTRVIYNLQNPDDDLFFYYIH